MNSEKQSKMKLAGLHHIAIICSDYRKSLSFYRDILGFKVLAEHYRAERDSYKTDLALNGEYLIELFSFCNPPERVTGPEAAGLRHLAFKVVDVREAVAELSDKGVSCEDIRTDPFTGREFVFFKDPDGLPWELYQA